MNDAVIRRESLLELHAAYSASLRYRTAAVVDLSALAFNRPRIHDTAHSSPAFEHWRHWTDQARNLKVRIDALEQRLRPDATTSSNWLPDDHSRMQLGRDCGAGGVT